MQVTEQPKKSNVIEDVSVDTVVPDDDFAKLMYYLSEILASFLLIDKFG